jgi:sulfur relay (sulfurtransferase) DsrF/TusC family protein
LVESVVIISDRAPVGINSAGESIRLGSGFVALGELIDCKIIYMGDAVYILSKEANPGAVGLDTLDEQLEIADLSELELCVLDSALEDAGLTKDDLIEYEMLKIITMEELTTIIDEAETCFRF